MDARLITISEHQANTLRYAPSAKSAARMLDVSESTVRRAASRLGVLAISGTAVEGFVRFVASPVDVSMAYSR